MLKCSPEQACPEHGRGVEGSRQSSESHYPKTRTTSGQALVHYRPKIETSTGQALVPLYKHNKTIENNKTIKKEKINKKESFENLENGNKQPRTVPNQDNLKTTKTKNYNEPL